MRRVLLLLAFPASLLACSANDDSISDGTGQQEAMLTCAPVVACAAPATMPLARRPWRHAIKAMLTGAAGHANHRGRDLFVNPGATQTIIAKIAYGILDKDLKDEEVDVFVQRDCAARWEKLGTTLTTGDGVPHEAMEGIQDNGGRVYFDIPASKQLGPGRHRVRLVVAGDGSSTDLFLDIVPPKTPIFVSDVDGTLTSSENIEYVKLLEGKVPEAHAGAAEALRALAAKGYRPIYVTARAEALVERTRDFLESRGFPPGLVHTTLTALGALGANAAKFKTEELAMLARKGLVPAFAFGNKTSDSDAYAAGGVARDHRVFYKISGGFEGRRIESYGDLLGDFAALPGACR